MKFLHKLAYLKYNLTTMPSYCPSFTLDNSCRFMKGVRPIRRLGLLHAIIHLPAATGKDDRKWRSLYKEQFYIYTYRIHREFYFHCSLYHVLLKDILIVVDPEDPVHRRNALVIIEKISFNMIDNKKNF